MATSYNGWTANKTPSAIGIKDFPWTTGAGVKGGAVWNIFNDFCEWFDKNIEPIRRDWSWDFSFRKFTGGTKYSCHASGTAIDLNAPKHPYGTKATKSFSNKQISAIRKKLAEYNGVVKWLDSTDPMHFEIAGTTSQVEAVAKAIKAGSVVSSTVGAVPAFPLPDGYYFGPRVPEDNAKSVSGYFSYRDDLRKWQKQVGITADGYYGNDTRNAAIALQTKSKLVVDGLIGPDTWSAAWN